MPVSVWNLLPNNRAYSFVGYVTSENLATLRYLEAEPIIEDTARDELQPTEAEDSHEAGVAAQQAPSANRTDSFGKPQDIGLSEYKDEEVDPTILDSNASVFSSEFKDEDAYSNIFSTDSIFSSSTRPTTSQS